MALNIILSSSPRSVAAPCGRLIRCKPLRCQLSRKNLIHITPHPRLAGLGGADQGVLGGAIVFGRVFVLRRIAATHVTALQAKPKVDPAVAHLHALLTYVFIGFSNA